MTRSVPCNWMGTEGANCTSASLLPAPAALGQGHCCLARAHAAPKCQGHLLWQQEPHAGDRNLHRAATPLLATRGHGLATTAVHWCAGPEGPAASPPSPASPASRAPAPALLLCHGSLPLLDPPRSYARLLHYSISRTLPFPGQLMSPWGHLNKERQVWGPGAKQKVGKAQSLLSGPVTSGLEPLDHYQPVCDVLTFSAACSVRAGFPLPSLPPQGQEGWGGQCRQVPRT